MLKITKYLLSIFVATILTASYVHADCGLTGEFCGRGINSVECCDGYFCDVAPNDAYARCTPICGQTDAFCGRGLNRVDCCKGFYCDVAPDDSYARCTPN